MCSSNKRKYYIYKPNKISIYAALKPLILEFDFQYETINNFCQKYNVSRHVYYETLDYYQIDPGTLSGGPGMKIIKPAIINYIPTKEKNTVPDTFFCSTEENSFLTEKKKKINFVPGGGLSQFWNDEEK